MHEIAITQLNSQLGYFIKKVNETFYPVLYQLASDN